jgi:ankyrin repeat domain-containing protein 50
MKLSFQPGTDEDRCIQALFVTDPVSDREGLITTKGVRTPGTFEWIPKTEEFQQWNAAHRGLLWISGPPGKGKTMISIFLSKLLETTKPNGTIIWFFRDDKNHSRNNAVNILRGLMSQLIQKHPRLLSCMLPTWKTQCNTLFGPESFETLWRIFTNMITALENTEVCCVLDALDECDETSLKTLLFKLKTVSESRSNDKTQIQLKVFITSREQPQCLPQYLSKFPRNTLSDLDDDIGLYISEKAAQLVRAKNIQESPLQERIGKAFRFRAGGTFLWVSFMIKDMELKTLHEIESCLDQLPRGLYAVYEKVMGQTAPKDRVMVTNILTWIMFAGRLLSVPELCDAVQIEPTKSLTREQVCLSYIQSCGHLLQLNHWVFNPHGKEDIIKWIVYAPSAIQLLHGTENFTVEGHEGFLSSLIVTFVHQSAKDFLLVRSADDHSKSPVSDSYKGHTLILNRLMSLLN